MKHAVGVGLFNMISKRHERACDRFFRFRVNYFALI
jgi:hypothetical protein